MNTAQKQRSGIDRRSWNPIPQTPFVDSSGLWVAADRRRRPDRRCVATTTRTTRSQVTLQGVYFERIGKRLFCWRINPQQYIGSSLEWLIYDEWDKKLLTFKRETDAKIIHSMTRFQRPQRLAKTEQIPEELIERFVERGWADIG